MKEGAVGGGEKDLHATADGGGEKTCNMGKTEGRKKEEAQKRRRGLILFSFWGKKFNKKADSHRGIGRKDIGKKKKNESYRLRAWKTY